MPMKMFTVLFLMLLAAAPAAADEAIAERLTQRLGELLPDNPVTSVRPAGVGGLYEVMLGTEVLYMTGDGRYLLRGDLMDLDARRNISEERRAEARVDSFKGVPAEQLIEFAPPNPRHVVYVFTDVDCTYCRRLHAEVEQLNARGVAVRYLAYPRAGPGSPTYRRTESVWCAPDRRQAMTDAKAGKPVPERSCDSPVQAQYDLGRTMGVEGTPTIILSNGRVVGGYVPADTLVRYVELGSQQ